MKPFQKGLAVALIHILLVLSLGAKLLYDRATRPRIWVRTGSVDPDLPIRGRYLTLSLEVHAPDFKPQTNNSKYADAPDYVELAVENGQLMAHRTTRPTGIFINRWQSPINGDVYMLSTPVVFFLPEHAQGPLLRSRGDELWAEVTVPHRGPPRPIQLAIKRGQQWTPLTYR